MFENCFSREMDQSPLPNFAGTQTSSTFQQNAADGDGCNSISRPLPVLGSCFRGAATLPHPARDEGGTDLRMSRTFITQLERHGCRQIYDPYHGAASKRLFAVKRKRLLKTSLYNRVNIGLVFRP